MEVYVRALHEEAQEAHKALHKLWQATGIEPVIRWMLDKLTNMLNYLSNKWRQK